MRTIFENAEFERNHYHGIKYCGMNLDIICPGYRMTDGSYVVVIPWYLIPGRPYPVQVYQFACSYYSSNPGVGQRAAAEATRSKFNLRTFSHSTVSRSFRSFEQSRQLALENSYGKEIKISGADGLIIAESAPKHVIKSDGSSNADTSKKPHTERRFPTVADTFERRGAIAVFLPKYPKDATLAHIESAGRQFAQNWHKQFRRLLL